MKTGKDYIVHFEELVGRDSNFEKQMSVPHDNDSYSKEQVAKLIIDAHVLGIFYAMKGPLEAYVKGGKINFIQMENICREIGDLASFYKMVAGKNLEEVVNQITEHRKEVLKIIDKRRDYRNAHYDDKVGDGRCQIS